MKIAIIGSRSLRINAACVARLVRQEYPNVSGIVSGGAKGVDSDALAVAKLLGVQLTEFLPKYAMFGRSAPMVRNRQIVENSEIIFAFWDGSSRGTLNTCGYAKQKGKIIRFFSSLPPPLREATL